MGPDQADDDVDAHHAESRSVPARVSPANPGRDDDHDALPVLDDRGRVDDDNGPRRTPLNLAVLMPPIIPC